MKVVLLICSTIHTKFAQTYCLVIKRNNFTDLRKTHYFINLKLNFPLKEVLSEATDYDAIGACFRLGCIALSSLEFRAHKKNSQIWR